MKNIFFDMRLAIVGSRKFTNVEQFKDELQIYLGKEVPIEVISGGAAGADTLGAKWAKERRIKLTVFKPNWKRYGKSAGFRRNKDIIQKATHVIAFPSRTGKGTQHSIKLANEQCKPCHVVWID